MPDLPYPSDADRMRREFGVDLAAVPKENLESLTDRHARLTKWFVGLAAQRYLGVKNVEMQECTDEFEAENTFLYLKKKGIFSCNLLDTTCVVSEAYVDRHLFRQNDLYHVTIDKIDDKYLASITKNCKPLAKFSFTYERVLSNQTSL